MPDFFAAGAVFPIYSVFNHAYLGYFCLLCIQPPGMCKGLCRIFLLFPCIQYFQQGEGCKCWNYTFLRLL